MAKNIPPVGHSTDILRPTEPQIHQQPPIPHSEAPKPTPGLIARDLKSAEQTAFQHTKESEMQAAQKRQEMQAAQKQKMLPEPKLFLPPSPEAAKLFLTTSLLTTLQRPRQEHPSENFTAVELSERARTVRMSPQGKVADDIDSLERQWGNLEPTKIIEELKNQLGICQQLPAGNKLEQADKREAINYVKEKLNRWRTVRDVAELERNFENDPDQNFYEFRARLKDLKRGLKHPEYVDQVANYHGRQEAEAEQTISLALWVAAAHEGIIEPGAIYRESKESSLTRYSAEFGGIERKQFDQAVFQTLGLDSMQKFRREQAAFSREIDRNEEMFKEQQKQYEKAENGTFDQLQAVAGMKWYQLKFWEAQKEAVDSNLEKAQEARDLLREKIAQTPKGEIAELRELHTQDSQLRTLIEAQNDALDQVRIKLKNSTDEYDKLSTQLQAKVGQPLEKYLIERQRKLVGDDTKGWIQLAGDWLGLSRKKQTINKTEANLQDPWVKGRYGFCEGRWVRRSELNQALLDFGVKAHEQIQKDDVAGPEIKKLLKASGQEREWLLRALQEAAAREATDQDSRNKVAQANWSEDPVQQLEQQSKGYVGFLNKSSIEMRNSDKALAQRVSNIIGLYSSAAATIARETQQEHLARAQVDVLTKLAKRVESELETIQKQILDKTPAFTQKQKALENAVGELGLFYRGPVIKARIAEPEIKRLQGELERLIDEQAKLLGDQEALGTAKFDRELSEIDQKIKNNFTLIVQYRDRMGQKSSFGQQEENFFLQVAPAAWKDMKEALANLQKQQERGPLGNLVKNPNKFAYELQAGMIFSLEKQGAKNAELKNALAARALLLADYIAKLKQLAEFLPSEGPSRKSLQEKIEAELTTRQREYDLLAKVKSEGEAIAEIHKEGLRELGTQYDVLTSQHQTLQERTNEAIEKIDQSQRQTNLARYQQLSAAADMLNERARQVANKKKEVLSEKKKIEDSTTKGAAEREQELAKIEVELQVLSNELKENSTAFRATLLKLQQFDTELRKKFEGNPYPDGAKSWSDVGAWLETGRQLAGITGIFGKDYRRSARELIQERQHTMNGMSSIAEAYDQLFQTMRDSGIDLTKVFNEAGKVAEVAKDVAQLKIPSLSGVKVAGPGAMLEATRDLGEALNNARKWAMENPEEAASLAADMFHAYSTLANASQFLPQQIVSIGANALASKTAGDFAADFVRGSRSTILGQEEKTQVMPPEMLALLHMASLSPYIAGGLTGLAGGNVGGRVGDTIGSWLNPGSVATGMLFRAAGGAAQSAVEKYTADQMSRDQEVVANSILRGINAFSTTGDPQEAFKTGSQYFVARQLIQDVGTSARDKHEVGLGGAIQRRIEEFNIWREKATLGEKVWRAITQGGTGIVAGGGAAAGAALGLAAILGTGGAALPILIVAGLIAGVVGAGLGTYGIKRLNDILPWMRASQAQVDQELDKRRLKAALENLPESIDAEKIKTLAAKIKVQTEKNEVKEVKVDDAYLKELRFLLNQAIKELPPKAYDDAFNKQINKDRTSEEFLWAKIQERLDSYAVQTATGAFQDESDQRNIQLEKDAFKRLQDEGKIDKKLSFEQYVLQQMQKVREIYVSPNANPTPGG